MAPTFSDNLGKQGYTVVARAPKVGLSHLANGSWHVLGGSNPNQPDMMHEFDHGLIPFILSKGGDIVLYRLSDDDMDSAKPVLTRGGMPDRPPDLSDVNSFDPELLRRLSEMQANVAKPVQQPTPAKPWADWRIAASTVAGLALLLGTMAYFIMPTQAPSSAHRWVPDMNNPRDVAITKGATFIVVPSDKDPDKMVMYRNYPSAKGKGSRDNVGTFSKRDLEGWVGDIKDSRMEWRTNF